MIETDQNILLWLLEMMDLHLPISENLKFSLNAKNLKQAEAVFKNLGNFTELHHKDVSQ